MIDFSDIFENRGKLSLWHVAYRLIFVKQLPLVYSGDRPLSVKAGENYENHAFFE